MADVGIDIEIVDKNSDKVFAAIDSLAKSLDKTLSSLDKSIQSLTKTITQQSKAQETLNKANEESVKATAESVKAYQDQSGVFGTLIKTAADVVAAITAVNLANNINLDILNKIPAGAEGVKTVFQNLGFFAQEAATLTKNLGQNVFLSNKNIFGFTVNLATAGAGLLAFGTLLKNSDSELLRFAGDTAFAAGLLLGGLSAALTLVISKLAQYASAIGTKMVEANKGALQTFTELEKKTFVFQRTLDAFNRAFGPVIGSTDSWTGKIRELSDATGETEKSLQAASNELISALAPLGFTEDALKKLLVVSNDYATQVGGDVVQASIDFISALNGNSQSVIKYGVHLSEAAVKQKLIEKGFKTNFESISETNKIQVRYNLLLDQYSPIAGVAADTTQTLAGQQKLLDNNLKRVSASFGSGVSIIENVNIAAFALNKALAVINPNLFAIAGFFSAAIGRALQFGGAILSVSFSVIALYKAFKLLDVFLKSNLIQSAVSQSIPFLNKSILDLIASTGAATVSLNGLGATARTFASVLVASLRNITAGLLGVSAASLSFSTIVGGILSRSIQIVATSVNFLATSLARLLLNPIALAVIALVAALTVLYKAFVAIEERTGAISRLLKVFSDILSGLFNRFFGQASIFGEVFSRLGDLIANGFGRIIQGVSFALQKFIDLILLLPQSILPSASAAELKGVQKGLVALNKDLEQSNFQLSALSKNSSDGRKNLGDLLKEVKNLDEELKKLKESLKNAGLNDLQIAKNLRAERLNIIDAAIKAEKLGIEEASALRRKVEADFQKSRLEFEKKLAEEQRKAIQKQVDDASAFVNLIQGKRPGSGQKGNASNVSFGNKIALSAAEGANQLLKGAEGAANLLKAGVGSIVSEIAGPVGQVLGPIVSELVGALAQGPAKVREMVTAFISSIPLLIENILLSIPVLIETLAEQLPLIIERLIENAPRIITEGILPRIPDIIVKLVEGMARASAELAFRMPLVAAQLGVSLAAQAPMIAAKTIDAFVSEAPRFISELIKSLPGSIGGAAGSIGGSIGDVFGGIGDVFGFAEGGRVPDSPKFMGDKFPARLNAGEQVIDRDLTKELEGFLARQREGGQPQSMNVTLQIGQKELASVLLDLSRGGFRTA